MLRISSRPCFNPHSSFRPSATRLEGRSPFERSNRFNPHSSFRPSATPVYAACQSYRCFNPHSSFRPSATSKTTSSRPKPTRFNPHSSFRPSATVGGGVDGGVEGVSILTRAFARVQPSFFRFVGEDCEFQSSLELSPECNAAQVPGAEIRRGVSILTRAFARVQPLPLPLLPSYRVSILTRAFARVQLGGRGVALEGFHVSILTRAFARVQHILTLKLVRSAHSFNPHSSFRPSATRGGGPPAPSRCRFNPHSSFRPSATPPCATAGLRSWFQSSLELSPECNQSTWSGP